jgi:hypothetical protein
MNYPTTTHALRSAMRETEQSPGQSVLDHGRQVARYFEDLRRHVLYQTPLQYAWKLPDWAYSPILWNNLLLLHTVRRYQLYHDVSKPFCRTVDDNGKHHFPDHARHSHDIWLAATQEQEVATLMAMDMDVHLLRGDGTLAFSQRPEAATLLLTGLAEVHANASMFGGIESTSFKIKHKHLKRRGNACVQHLTQLTQGEAA